MASLQALSSPRHPAQVVVGYPVQVAVATPDTSKQAEKADDSVSVSQPSRDAATKLVSGGAEAKLVLPSIRQLAGQAPVRDPEAVRGDGTFFGASGGAFCCAATLGLAACAAGITLITLGAIELANKVPAHEDPTAGIIKLVVGAAGGGLLVVAGCCVGACIGGAGGACCGSAFD